MFVVDDDEAARDSLVMLLKSDGLASRGFASAHDFLATFDPIARGCIITDLRMPSMDGIELIRALKGVLEANPPDMPLYQIVNALMGSSMGNPNWLLEYWSRERLMSVDARREWLGPDLKPLPF